jgi:hypothetical protein
VEVTAGETAAETEEVVGVGLAAGLAVAKVAGLAVSLEVNWAAGSAAR